MKEEQVIEVYGEASEATESSGGVGLLKVLSTRYGIWGRKSW